jgi:hypothetical protein
MKGLGSFGSEVLWFVVGEYIGQTLLFQKLLRVCKRAFHKSS